MSDLDRDAEFIGRVTGRLEGWLTDDDAAVTADLLRAQETWEGDAPLVEIGVYCGKYLSLLMASAARTHSRVLGIDTFQFKDLATVREGLTALAPELMAWLSLHQGSSGALTADSFLTLLGRPPGSSASTVPMSTPTCSTICDWPMPPLLPAGWWRSMTSSIRWRSA